MDDLNVLLFYNKYSLHFFKGRYLKYENEPLILEFLHVLSALQILPNLNFKMTLWGRGYYAYFMNEEVETQRY